MYGILRVTIDENGDTMPPMFKREYVSIGGKPLAYETEEKAQSIAEGMTAAAREEGILAVGYRARKIDL
jgi:hypothetical protein